MDTTIHILHLEDDPADAELIRAKVDEADLSFQLDLVRTRDEYELALQKNKWDIILADFKLPMYDGMSALMLAKELRPDVPFIFVSGTMGEEAAIEGLIQGATDYVLKHNLSRLPSAVERALSEARNRRQRRQAERALAESENKMRSILEYIGVGVALISPEMEILEMNRRMSKWFPGVDLGKHPICYKVFNRPARQEICDYCPTCKTLADGLVHDATTQTPQDGAIRNYRIVSSPLFNTDGEVIAAIEMVDDVTERLQEQQVIQQTNEMLRAIIEAAPVAIIGLDLDGCVHSVWNPAAEKMLGWSAQEAMGRPFSTVPKDKQEEFRGFQRQLRKGMNLKDVEVRRQRRDGTPIDYSIYASPLRDADDHISGNISVLVDITERKKAEASIRKLSLAIEQSPVSIVITDVSGKIEFVNAKFTQITGYTYIEALGQNPSIIKSGETPIETYRQLWETISSGGVWQGQLKNRKKNGELFWEQATIAPVRDAHDNITHYVAVKEDITKRKTLEEQLRQVQKMEAIGQLAGGIAHDFNNILSAIVGYTELSQSLAEQDSQISYYLGQVMEAGGRAKELINQILMFSRETVQELRPIRISYPVKEALKLIRASVPASIEIRSDILSKSHALADSTQIHQIVMNLCTNAAHAMREKGGLLQLSLTDIIIDTENPRQRYPDAKPGEYILLTVTDQGHGIDAKHLHRIFDPFFTTKGIGEGTGMGLSVIHGIVKSYGGFIYANSRLGEGSTFEVLIPAHESAQAHAPDFSVPIPTGRESILFVDDENMIADIVGAMLESLGYHVVTSTSPVEAIEVFKNNSDDFDLVVTDMAMPKMSGLDLAEKILKIRPGFPIVICTGFSLEMGEATIKQHGLSDIIYKPILRRDIATVVRNTLDNR
ncbi:MAG: PAS domain S-box protein [Desulfobacteraceae bacterium]